MNLKSYNKIRIYSSDKLLYRLQSNQIPNGLISNACAKAQALKNCNSSYIKIYVRFF